MLDYSGLERRLREAAPDVLGISTLTFNLIDCYPLHFNILNVENGRSDVIHWTLEVRVNRWECA